MKDQLRGEADKWLTAALAQLDLDREGPETEKLCSRIRDEKPAFQVALLTACVERLPLLRAQASTDRSAYRLGSILYGTVCALYGDRLPYDEEDICELLRQSKHDCGHGMDVAAPFDLAVDHARRFGLTRPLLEAVGVFVDGLTGLQSIKAQTVKRRAALMLVLDTDGCVDRRPCWSDGFRLGLGTLPAHERVLWHQLVLQMNLSEQPRIPNTWRTISETFADTLALSHVVRRFSEWWPIPRPEPWALESGGSQVLRHFVWTLHVMRERATSEDALLCDGLVRQLAFVDWKPRQRAKKVATAAATYLVERTPDIAAEALQRFSQWSTTLKYSDWEANRVAVLAMGFAKTHGLDRAAFATPHTVQTPLTSASAAASAPSTRKGWLERILAMFRRASGN